MRGFGRAFFITGWCFMDKLQKQAIAFRQLMNYQYMIKLGRKGQIYSFVLDFQKQRLRIRNFANHFLKAAKEIIHAVKLK